MKQEMKIYITIVLVFKQVLCENHDVTDIINSYQQRNIPSHERHALYDLYAATDGDSWVYQYGDEGHWNFTDPDVNPCSSSDPWQGLNCTTISTESHYSYVSEIILSDYNLHGTISESIGTVTKYNYN